ncbi:MULTISPECIES: glycosyltransferase family 2 protein [Winogradskyella]|uniref:glycosyltransferase family 2 protein n=1 Tax=Winogradskyella TaxID=286104 RepID=UPI0015CE1134|nr:MULTISPECIES: glycosyltransferase family 2 protein [Winogradskyella]QNK77425.1 glycosyltransferase [Winogradskyella sp. PAMC22761]QXP80012.1 glycosyltransferase [Winogradskyella sp. HaHa_3_26]
MKVSIITATYNSEKTIEACMASVLHQSYPDIEYIIVDGGSNAETLELLHATAKEYPNIILSSEPDKGIYDALNKGIAKATGAIVGFVHSDDFLADNDVISTIVAAFNTHQVDGVYGDLHYVALENTDKVIRNWISQPFVFNLLKQGWMPAHPTLYLKKSIYDKYGLFDLKYKIAADYDFILRIFRQENLSFFYLPKTIVKMRIGGASNKNLKNILQKSKEDYRAIKTNHIGNWLTVLLKNVSKLKQFKA